MTASPRLIDLDALVDVSNYSSLETCAIRPCRRLCNSHSSVLSLTLYVCVCKSVHTPNCCDSQGVTRRLRHNRVIITTLRAQNLLQKDFWSVSQSESLSVTHYKASPHPLMEFL